MFDYNPIAPWTRNVAAPAWRDREAPSLGNLHREIDRLFDRFFEDRDLMSFRNGALSPQIDVEERDKELVVTADLPGVDDKDVDVELSGDLLTIKGEKKAESEDKNGGRYVSERFYGSFERSIRLPFEAGEGEPEATFDKGVLTVRLPKPENAGSKSRRIAVKSGE
jgi:HSP20 family protein